MASAEPRRAAEALGYVEPPRAAAALGYLGCPVKRPCAYKVQDQEEFKRECKNRVLMSSVCWGYLVLLFWSILIYEELLPGGGDVWVWRLLTGERGI